MLRALARTVAEAFRQMTSSDPETRGLVSSLSARGLFFASLLFSMLIVIGLALSIFLSAQRSNDTTRAAIETRLLTLLEEGGTASLMVAIEQATDRFLPGQDRIEVAVWRARSGTRTLLRETSAGIGTLFAPVQTGMSAKVDFDDSRFIVRAIDVASTSQDWSLPMSDIEVRFGISTPTVVDKTARRTILLVVLGSALALTVGLALHAVHWRRYRTGLTEINSLLDRYAAGETGIRPDGRSGPPELANLVKHLDVVLPRFDTLLAELRSISAHLAHELKTPLQAIRSEIGKITAAEDAETREALARSVDGKIDAANARLQTVMQLFRLQSDAHVPIEEDLALGTVLVDLIYDFEDMLAARGRKLHTEIDETVHVNGNAYLVELMIENLLMNAAKYAPPDAEIIVGLSCSDKDFTLEVSNTGGTFPKALAERAFERFARGTDHEEIAGVGLGLSIVKAIVERHGFKAALPARTDPSGKPMATVQITGPIRTSSGV